MTTIKELKVGDIVRHNDQLVSVLANIRGPFRGGIGSFLKLVPIKQFEDNGMSNFYTATPDTQYQGKPYIRVMTKKYCTQVMLEKDGESPDVTSVGITIE